MNKRIFGCQKLRKISSNNKNNDSPKLHYQELFEELTVRLTKETQKKRKETQSVQDLENL
jgi:hypothetical protein